MRQKKLLKRGLALGLATAMTLTMAPNVGLLNGIMVVQANSDFTSGGQFKLAASDDDTNHESISPTTLMAQLNSVSDKIYTITVEDASVSDALTGTIKAGNTLILKAGTSDGATVNLGTLTINGTLQLGENSTTAKRLTVKMSETEDTTVTVAATGIYQNCGSAFVEQGNTTITVANGGKALLYAATKDDDGNITGYTDVKYVGSDDGYVYKTSDVDITLKKADESDPNLLLHLRRKMERVR